MMYHWAKEIPDAVYLRQPINGQYTDYTWKEVNRQVRLIAGYLKSLTFLQEVMWASFRKTALTG